MSDPAEPLPTGGATNRGLVITGAMNQSATLLQLQSGQSQSPTSHLQEFQQTSDGTNYTNLSYVDAAGNFVGPTIGSGATQYSSRLIMNAARYPLAQGGKDFIAMTPNSNPTNQYLQSQRPGVMFQFHSTDFQNSIDTVLQNFNVIQQGNVIGSLALTSGGTGYSQTQVPSVLILNDPTGTAASASATLSVASVTVNQGGMNYQSSDTVAFETPPPPGIRAQGSLVLGPGGAITGVTITNPGSGYTRVPVMVLGTTTGTGASLTAVMQVGAVTITNPGPGFYVAPLISFEGGGGTGAAATATLSVGSVSIRTDINSTAGGSGYTSAPMVTFSAAPQGATAMGTAIMSGGGVIAINLQNPGANYLTAPTISFDSVGETRTAKATAYITGGVVTSIVVTDSGAGYTTTPGVTFGMAPNNTTAGGTASVSAGAVTGVSVSPVGTGYTSTPTISFSGVPGGTGATAVALMQLASITPFSGGSGYTRVPTVVITPNGLTSNASATCTVDGSGHVSSVALSATLKGMNYFTAPPILIVGGYGNGATVTATLATVGRTGLEIDSYTQPDNGGEISGALFVQSGGGNALTAYKMSETGRLPGFVNYWTSHGMAIECGTADPWYAIECGAGGFGSANTGGCIMLRLANSTAKGLLVTPEIGTFDGRIAYAIGVPQVGQPDSNLTFAVQLNGNISTQGQLAVGAPAGLVSAATQATILASADTVKGLVVRAHSGTATANLQEWQDPAGNVLAAIGAHGAIMGSVDPVTYAVTISLDVTRGALHKTTATSDATMNASAPGNPAQVMMVLIVNDANGSWKVTFGTYFKAAGGGSVTGTPSKAALLLFASDGNTWYEVARTTGLG